MGLTLFGARVSIVESNQKMNWFIYDTFFSDDKLVAKGFLTFAGNPSEKLQEPTPREE
jgi:hypothetical protein